MATSPSSSAVRALQQELKNFEKEPVEGFRIDVSDDNMMEWDIAIFGPPGTLYEGGYFKAKMNFPPDYPYSPPTIRFTTKLWHPNVYQNGDVCISILHPPIEDLQSGELPCERWNPAQTVRTVLLSVISLLNEPNTFSPANVDASVMYRKWKDSKAKDKEYENIIRKQTEESRKDAERDGIKVPTTLSEYCITAKPKKSEPVDMDFFDDDFDKDDYDDMEDEDDDDDEVLDDDEDSGNGES